MAAGEEFTRAKCSATGAIASLPKNAVDLGHIPGWEAVDGPLPESPKPAAFPPVAATESVAVPKKTQSAGSKSAQEKE